MKYSIIIPVYNAEKTLRRCIDSLVDQQCYCAEILLINDGSADRSGEICHEYAGRYSNVRCFDKENGGVSSARNMGLDHAVGEYILFVDSDDWVDRTYFHTIDALLAQYSCDYLIFSSSTFRNNEYTQKHLPQKHADNPAELMDIITDAMCRKYINVPVAKVFMNSIIQDNHLRFHNEISIGEDRTFNLQYAMHIQSMAVTDISLYFFDLSNDASLSRSVRLDLDDQMKKAEIHVLAELEKSSFSEAEKKAFTEAHRFDFMRTVYTKAKYLHRLRTPWFARIRHIHSYCRSVNRCRYRYPENKYCTLIHLPVKWYMTWLIDAMAWYLTR